MKLYDLIQNENIDDILTLLKESNDIYETDEDGDDALIMSIFSNTTEITKLLLQYDNNYKYIDNEILQKIIKNCDNIDLLNIDNIETIYCYNKSNNTDKQNFLKSLIKYLHFANDNKIKLLDFYFKNNGNIDVKIYYKNKQYIVDDYNTSIIHDYMINKNLITLRNYLMNNNNELTEYYYNTIYYMIDTNNVKSLQDKIQNGFDIQGTNIWNQITEVITNNYLEIFKILINTDIDIYRKYNKKYDILYYSLYATTDEFTKSILEKDYKQHFTTKEYLNQLMTEMKIYDEIHNLNFDSLKYLFDKMYFSDVKYMLENVLIKYIHFSGKNISRLLKLYYEFNGDVNVDVCSRYKKINVIGLIMIDDSTDGQQSEEDANKTTLRNYILSKCKGKTIIDELKRNSITYEELELLIKKGWKLLDEILTNANYINCKNISTIIILCILS
jgi:hypothetical protein